VQSSAKIQRADTVHQPTGGQSGGATCLSDGLHGTMFDVVAVAIPDLTADGFMAPAEMVGGEGDHNTEHESVIAVSFGHRHRIQSPSRDEG
jgi:hypothetical protein